MKRNRLNVKKQIAKKISLNLNKKSINKNVELKMNGKADRNKLRMPDYNHKSSLKSESNKLSSNLDNNLDNNKYLPILENKESISIIITAYKTQDFIEECLDSIENQTYFINNNNYEILVGVDACQDTLNKLLSIQSKYRNLRIFMMKKNRGTYVTSNTLLNIVKFDNIIRFDSDDVMKLEMINEIMYLIDSCDVIKLKFKNFINTINNTISNENYACGALFYKRKIINILGGYKPWKCAADYEFLKRIPKYINIGETNKLMLFRRMHPNALTKNIITGMKSKYRSYLLSKIPDIYLDNEIKINPIINEYIEI